ncbi:uncharacterized protein IWZ02DRAFT_178017 [Phyllosticta citriasiana]|uniref:uncharacterized protein n=1 Tax=Phyllosticta citriasiana TaxID=595635 RepID=UPI0030FD42C8
MSVWLLLGFPSFRHPTRASYPAALTLAAALPTSTFGYPPYARQSPSQACQSTDTLTLSLLLPHCTACSVLFYQLWFFQSTIPHTTTTRCDRPGPDCSSHAATKQAYHSRALLRGACSLHYTTIRHWILPTRPLRHSHRLPPSSTTLYLPSSGPSSAHCPPSEGPKRHWTPYVLCVFPFPTFAPHVDQEIPKNHLHQARAWVPTAILCTSLLCPRPPRACPT